MLLSNSPAALADSQTSQPLLSCVNKSRNSSLLRKLAKLSILTSFQNDASPHLLDAVFRSAAALLRGSKRASHIFSKDRSRTIGRALAGASSLFFGQRAQHDAFPSGAGIAEHAT